MLAAFLSQPVLSAVGDTLLSTPEDKSSKRFGCLDPEVDGDPKKACRNHRSVWDTKHACGLAIKFTWQTTVCCLAMAEPRRLHQLSFLCLSPLLGLTCDAGSHLIHSSNPGIHSHNHSLSWNVHFSLSYNKIILTVLVQKLGDLGLTWAWLYSAQLHILYVWDMQGRESTGLLQLYCWKCPTLQKSFWCFAEKK